MKAMGIRGQSDASRDSPLIMSPCSPAMDADLPMQKSLMLMIAL